MNKQILVVIGGVTFTSLPVGEFEAKHVMNSFKTTAPNTDPMIVDANDVVVQLPPGDYIATPVTTHPKSVKLDAIRPQVLKSITDYLLSVDLSLKCEGEAIVRVREMRFDELFRAYCAWQGYAINHDSLARVVLELHHATDNSNS